MKKAELMNTVGRAFTKVSFKFKKHSPEILAIAGVAGAVASAIMACKATTKISNILEKSKGDVDTIHNCVGNKELAEEYSSEDAKKDLAVVYVQTGVKLIRLYAPAVLLGALSITSILASNNILRKRNVALAAAYATVDKGFKEYRSKVVERFGEEIDRELRYNIKAKQFEETITDPETGKEKKVKKTVNVADPNMPSEFARFFDKSCKAWEESADYNEMFLRAQQQYANDLLISRRHLYLNEVYDMLGIERTKAGQQVGWVYSPNNERGDNYVDFGICEMGRETDDSYTNAFLLDFNVDGYILDLMD